MRSEKPAYRREETNNNRKTPEVKDGEVQEEVAAAAAAVDLSFGPRGTLATSRKLFGEESVDKPVRN
ncbi:hypothetical protein ZHAS_00021502 [Anopheles sinensis]|uniref:Uncharacterized protein n=1 Tax=Anopheles sinensis TaxID=74873 RepID=A0A084WSK3_ANOSI|nr:hypothetical protein ZHAS_00021502 [Anopheles sinensis]